VLLAAVGGTLFVRGLLAAASRLRLPPSFIGIPFAASATSGPELVVAIVGLVLASG